MIIYNLIGGAKILAQGQVHMHTLPDPSDVACETTGIKRPKAKVRIATMCTFYIVETTPAEDNLVGWDAVVWT